MSEERKKSQRSLAPKNCSNLRFGLVRRLRRVWPPPGRTYCRPARSQVAQNRRILNRTLCKGQKKTSFPLLPRFIYSSFDGAVNRSFSPVVLVAGAPKAGFAAPKSPPPAAGWAVEPKAPVEPKAGAAEVAVAPKPPGNITANDPTMCCEYNSRFSKLLKND